MYAATGARLGRAVLGYVAAVVLVITLEPFTFRWPDALALTWWAPDSPWFGAFDAVANVALFVPLGFLGALTRSATDVGGDGRGRVRAALLLGALLSLVVECTQVFEPGRYPSPTDVLTNALGAALGAALHARTARHLGADSPLLGRLALELPVMGLVYVLLPLLTLTATTAAAGARDVRALGLVLLGGAGGALLGTVQRRHLGPQGAARPRMTAAAAAAWFGAGALPALATTPRAYLTGAALAAGVTFAVGRQAVVGVRDIDRRFEGEALARATPWLAAYALLLPFGDAGAPTWGRLVILRDLEYAVAFTALGYVLSEGWGRREWRYRRTAWVVAGVAATGAAVLEAAAGALGELHWTARAGAALVACACWGGWLYHLQRAHVRALVEARRSAGAGPQRTAARAAGARAA